MYPMIQCFLVYDYAYQLKNSLQASCSLGEKATCTTTCKWAVKLQGVSLTVASPLVC